MTDEMQIVKRDGSKENFSYDKLVTSIAKTGVPIEDSENIAKLVESWILSQSDGYVKSTEIRDQITEKLMKDFPIEADNYQAFKKS